MSDAKPPVFHKVVIVVFVLGIAALGAWAAGVFDGTAAEPAKPEASPTAGGPGELPAGHPPVDVKGLPAGHPPIDGLAADAKVCPESGGGGGCGGCEGEEKEEGCSDCDSCTGACDGKKAGEDAPDN